MGKWYRIYAFITVVCWAFSNVLTGMVMRELSTFALAFWRYLIASIAVVVIICLKKLELPQKKDIPWFLISGGLGFFLYTICFNLGCEKTTSAVSSTIIAAVPILTAVFSGVTFKEKIRRKQWGGILLSFSGVLFLVIQPEKMIITPGILWLLCAAVILSGYNLVQRKLTQKYSALQASVYSILCGFILLCMFMPQSIEQAKYLTVEAWGCLLVMGIFSSAIAYVCWSKALSMAPKTSNVSNFMFLTPFVAAVMGYVILDEMLNMQIITGGILILSGLIWFRREENRVAKKK